MPPARVELREWGGGGGEEAPPSSNYFRDQKLSVHIRVKKSEKKTVNKFFKLPQPTSGDWNLELLALCS